MDVCPNLVGWGLPGPSSASFSSSLRWLSQSAAAAHSYGWTGKLMKILFHPRQNPWKERSLHLKDGSALREKAQRSPTRYRWT